MKDTLPEDFIKGVNELKESLASCLDKHFGMKVGEAFDSARDRMVVTALISMAAWLAYQDGSELGAIKLFVDAVVDLYREEHNHTGHGCVHDPKKQPSA